MAISSDKTLREAALIIVRDRWISLFHFLPEELFSEEEIIESYRHIQEIKR